MLNLELRYGILRGRRVRLRELHGHDELALASGCSGLVRQLLYAVDEDDVAEDETGHLALADRDRLLTLIHRTYFDDRVAGRVPCTAGCPRPFEFTLSLSELEASLQVEAPDVTGPDERGEYVWQAGTRFRVPDEDDLVAGQQAPVSERRRRLLGRCLIESEPTRSAPDPAEFEAILQRVAPLLDVELSLKCPECGALRSVRFEIQRYLDRAFRLEAGLLTREIHQLAWAYGWQRDTILDLPRSQRREHARLIELDRQGRRRSVA